MRFAPDHGRLSSPPRSARAARIMTVVLLLAALVFFLPTALSAAPVSPTTLSEIAHLLDYVEKSGCEFFRNGTWYTDAKTIRGHVEMKYHYFMDKGKIASAEDFIKWSATKSELSGRPYMVKCGEGPDMPMSYWMARELDRYRKEKPGR